MLTSRDKLLAGLFAVQLTAAAAFGAVLVHGLHHETTGTPTLAAGTEDTTVTGSYAPASGAAGGVAEATSAPTTVASMAAGASAAAVASGAAVATGPHTVTTVVGGSAGTSGSAGSGVGKTPTGTGLKGGKATTTAKASASASATAAAGAAGASEIAPGAPIKIGSIVTESGAINFNSSAQGTKAYIDMINAAGGVAGHKIQLIQDDDQLNAETGDKEFQSLAAQGVFAFGAFQAPDTEGGLQPLLDQYGIPLIGSYGERAEYVDKLAFAFTAYYSHYGYEMGKYLKGLGVTKPALVFVTNNDNQSDNAIISGFTDGFGAAPTYKDIAQPTDQYQNVVLTMRSMGVDGLASILDPTSYNRFLQAAGSYATQIKHVADPLFAVPAVVSGDESQYAQGTYVASDFAFTNSTDPAVQQYVSTVKAEFPNAGIDYIGEVGWFDAKLIVDALKSMNGVFTKAGLISAVENLGTYTTGLTSPLTFAPGVRDINKCIQFGKIENSAVTPVQGYTCDSEPVS